MSAVAAGTRLATRSARLQLDPVVIGLTAALLLLGLVMVTSASVTLAARDGDPLFFLERQLLFALLGIGCAAVALRIPTAAWERLSLVLLIVSFVLLVLVLVPGIGHAVNGSRRWLRLGGLNFQASEAARVLLLLYLCSYLVRREEEVRTTVLGFLKPLMVLGAAALLLLVEPDFGSGVVLLTTGIGLLFLAGVRLRHFLALCASALVLFAALAVSSPYRLRRLLTFLDPWADPFNSGFQLTQSLIAIGRGEVFGVGLGASIQKLFYLPEAHTDFLFAVLAEELGLLGVVLTLVLFVALVWRSFHIARLAARVVLTFPAYLASGFGLWVGIQAFINIGVNMGVLPTKGLTLPFMSYGRSSMIVALAWLGLLLRVYHEASAKQRGSATVRSAA